MTLRSSFCFYLILSGGGEVHPVPPETHVETRDEVELWISLEFSLRPFLQHLLEPVQDLGVDASLAQEFLVVLLKVAGRDLQAEVLAAIAHAGVKELKRRDLKIQ